MCLSTFRCLAPPRFCRVRIRRDDWRVGDGVNLTVTQVLITLIALVGGSGTIGALIAAGVLHKWIKPAIRDEIRVYEGEASTVDARRAHVRAVVDDQVRRDDGVIREHTRESAERAGTELREMRQTLTTVLDEIAQLRGMLTVVIGQLPRPQAPASRQMMRPPTPPHGVPR